MSFKKEKLTIMIRKKVILISPSSKLKPTVGRTGCRYPRTESHARRTAESEAPASGGGVAGLPACGPLVAAGVFAQPAATKMAFVKSRGAATNNRMLNIRAKTIELAAAAVVPFFNSSFERF